MALQATSVAASCLFMKGICRPLMFPPHKARGNVCFASTNSPLASSTASPQAPSIVTHQQDGVVRPLRNNNSSELWFDRFITLPFTNSEFESCSREVEVMKKMVKDMLSRSTEEDPIKNILLINSLSRLGVSYHFETEIEEQLSHLFITLPQLIMDDIKDYNLHTVATIFQLFRSHGYKMTCDVFKKFKKDDMFKEELAGDIQGIISLYEASQWGTHEEDILDNALVFTTLHLESLVVSQSCPNHLKEYVAKALNRPYHKGMPRLESRQYIAYYEKLELKNDVLLRFAKYDFNRVQMLYQKELSLLSSWWKNSNIASKFPHVRQRVVECFFVGLGMLFEPRYALARDSVTKWFMVYTIMDDTYDAYASYEELQCFEKALERFEIGAMDELPGDYLKSVYEIILKISDEVEEEVSKIGRSFTAPYNKVEVMKLVRNYSAQARWTYEHIQPRFDEYLEIGAWSIGVPVSLTPLMMGMEEVDEHSFQWLINCYDQIMRAPSALCRLYNDLVTNESQERRGGQLSGITCYMNEYGVSKEEAIEGYRELIRSTWKDLNEGFMLRPTTPVPWNIFMASFNYARMTDIFYKDEDEFSEPGTGCKDCITKVLIDPIPL